MVVIREATYITRCVFSKELIKPHNKICLFNKQQYDAFEKIIYEVLDSRLPGEIIQLIIQSTNYQNCIGRFGHEKITHWTAKTTKSGRISMPPLKYGRDRKWVKGSGFNGCDQYDRGYNGGAISASDSEEESDLDGFIVNDSEESGYSTD